MNASLIVILLMAVTVVIALGISMASFNSSSNATWLFVAQDPRETGTKLHFEVEADDYNEALQAANEVRTIYYADGVDFEWIEVWLLDSKTKEKTDRVFYKQTETESQEA
mgnify:CR=1